MQFCMHERKNEILLLSLENLVSREFGSKYEVKSLLARGMGAPCGCTSIIS